MKNKFFLRISGSYHIFLFNFATKFQDSFMLSLFLNSLILFSLKSISFGLPPTTMPKYLLFKNYLLTAKSRLSLFLFVCFLLLLLFFYFLYAGLSYNWTQLVFVHLLLLVFCFFGCCTYCSPLGIIAQTSCLALVILFPLMIYLYPDDIYSSILDLCL